jgi:hypothetical protein
MMQAHLSTTAACCGCWLSAKAEARFTDDQAMSMEHGAIPRSKPEFSALVT